MIALRLTRDIRKPHCTLGRLEVLDETGKVLNLYTMERPWIPSKAGGKSGERFVSCISVGTYDVRPHVRPNGDHVWILSNPALDVYALDTDIPQKRKNVARYLILIHVGNYVRDIIGCIAPGLGRVEGPKGKEIVTNSLQAMHDLHALLDGMKKFEMVIRNG
jgi:hypothetical protein